jgi:GntR family transcriptional regulator, vanillate catabolism transcriptional regulator
MSDALTPSLPDSDPDLQDDDSAPLALRLEDASVVASLRKLIIEGHFAPGERLAELAVANALHVSRTPVRLAFRTLEQEGLLQKAGKRGFVVREFSEADVLCALEVRGVLEGLAARHLAERGMSAAVREQLEACLDDGRRLLAAGAITDQDIGRWSALNQAFHSCIVGADASAVIADAIARNDHLPFASADSIIIDTAALDREYEKLRVAQMQHELVVDALVQRESARVEMLMREHAYVGFRYGQLFGLAAPRVRRGPL